MLSFEALETLVRLLTKFLASFVAIGFYLLDDILLMVQLRLINSKF